MAEVLIRKEALRDATCYLRFDPRDADRLRHCLNEVESQVLRLALEGKRPFPAQFCACHCLTALLAYYLTDRIRIKFDVVSRIRELVERAELHEHAKLALAAVLGDDEPGQNPSQASISSM